MCSYVYRCESLYLYIRACMHACIHANKVASEGCLYASVYIPACMNV